MKAFAVLTTVVACLMFSGCGSSQAGVSQAGTCAPVHSEACAKAVATGIQAKAGSRKVACWYEHMQAQRMHCDVFKAPWLGQMRVYVRDNRWHVTVIVTPDNVVHKAPLSGVIT